MNDKTIAITGFIAGCLLTFAVVMAVSATIDSMDAAKQRVRAAEIAEAEAAAKLEEYEEAMLVEPGPPPLPDFTQLGRGMMFDDVVSLLGRNWRQRARFDGNVMYEWRVGHGVTFTGVFDGEYLIEWDVRGL